MAVFFSCLMFFTFECSQPVYANFFTDTSGGVTPGATSGGVTPSGQLKNPLGDVTYQDVAGKIVQTALGMSGVLALIAFIWGGISWMTSGGDTSKIKKGKDMMIWAVAGIVIIFGSYAILNLVFTSLGA